MPDYRRTRVRGGTFFFTVVSYRRRPVLCDKGIRAAIRQAVYVVRNERPFDIDAWVLLPDHLHCVWTLPPNDADFSTRWAMIKRYVTKTAHGARSAPYDSRPSAVGCVSRTVTNGARSAPYKPQSKIRRHEGFLWQRRFWEHTVRDNEDLKRCLDYVHWNPVKHGHVSRVADWPFSTFHRYVRQGMYGPDWGGSVAIDDRGFGE
jgi:putative transposase